MWRVALGGHEAGKVMFRTQCFVPPSGVLATRPSVMSITMTILRDTVHVLLSYETFLLGGSFGA